MRPTRAARTSHRTLRRTAVGLVVVTAATIAALAYQSASSSASSFSEPASTGNPGALPPPMSSSAPSFSKAVRGDHPRATTGNRAAVTEADGVLPGGVTVFADQYPGVANLDPDLRRALREAATDAAQDGVTFYVNSGWRSRTYQDQLLREA